MEGCDCLENGAPSELTIKKYIAAAESGVGIVWFEACAVCPEGRTSKRQMWLTEENLHAFKALVSDMRRITRERFGYDQFLILQLTHSGRQSITPIIAYRHPLYEKTRPVTDANIASDEYLDTLPTLYAKTAELAIEAGFDGVDVKSCHGYLFQELLSEYNREGRYQKLMSRSFAFLRNIKNMESSLEEIKTSLDSFTATNKWKNEFEISEIFKNLDIIRMQYLIASAMIYTAKKYGSRGSTLVTDGGNFLCGKKIEENEAGRGFIVTAKGLNPEIGAIPVKPIPTRDLWFESVWNKEKGV